MKKIFKKAVEILTKKNIRKDKTMEAKKFYTLEELYNTLIALKERAEHANKVYVENPTELNLKLKKYIDIRSTKFLSLCVDLNAYDDVMEVYYNGGCYFGNELKRYYIGD